jgi:dihydrofolate reductase
MGRVRYEEWSAYWPEHADEPFGGVLNATKKYVVSKYVVSNTLANAEWQNSEILGGDVAAKVGALKAEDGGDMVMLGSATMVRWLLREGLLDELHLFVHPIAVGASMARLFPSDAPRTALSLTSSETFDTGVVYLTYAPACALKAPPRSSGTGSCRIH